MAAQGHHAGLRDGRDQRGGEVRSPHLFLLPAELDRIRLEGQVDVKSVGGVGGAKMETGEYWSHINIRYQYIDNKGYQLNINIGPTSISDIVSTLDIISISILDISSVIISDIISVSDMSDINIRHWHIIDIERQFNINIGYWLNIDFGYRFSINSRYW